VATHARGLSSFHIKYVCGLIIGGFHTVDRSVTAIYIFLALCKNYILFINNDSKLSKTYLNQSLLFVLNNNFIYSCVFIYQFDLPILLCWLNIIAV